MGVTHQELAALCKKSLENPEGFWSEVAGRLSWSKPWNKVYDDSDSPFCKWFLGGEINLCHNCLDRHVDDGYADRVALIYLSPVTDTRREYTFKDILDRVARLSGALRSWGVGKGDAVMIYMPMTPEGIFSMLSCTRIGALHVAVPSGLPAEDLAARLDYLKPKVIITSSYGYHANGWLNYMDEVNGACEISKNKPEKVLVFQRTFKEPVPLKAGRDFDWKETLLGAQDAPCIPQESNDPVFMVYTSGSTGPPKGIVHSVGRFSVRMMQDIPILMGSPEDDEVVFMPCQLGWLASHFLVCYGPLMHKIKTILFEGTPLLTEDVHMLYKILSEEKVTRCLITPGISKLLKGKDSNGEVAGKYNFDSLKHIFTGGERADMTTLNWATRIFHAPIWIGWGQSECGGLVTGVPDKSVGKSSNVVMASGVTSPGWRLVLRKSDGTDAGPNELGRILLKFPLPPGSVLTLFQNQEQCRKAYYTEYPGYHDTKDIGFMDEKGELTIECRSDDVMQVGKVMLSAQAVEEVVLSHTGVAECVVVSVPDSVWTDIPVAIYMKRDGVTQPAEEVAEELNKMVADKFGPGVKFGGAILVKELPRTRTGKVHRPSSNALARGQKVLQTGAVENPYVFDDVISALEAAGYAKD